MAPAYNWTGCYVNGGFGYGVSNTDHNAETLPGLVPIDGRNTSGARGWLGIAGAGCDFEVPFAGLGNWVVGAFGDYSFMNIHEPMQEFLLQGDAKQTDAWAVGGRVGYVVTPNLLAYYEWRLHAVALQSGQPASGGHRPGRRFQPVTYL